MSDLKTVGQTEFNSALISELLKMGVCMEIGDRFEVLTTVTEQNTALAVGSGDLPVFATPMLVTLMEEAAKSCAEGTLEVGQTTVGCFISVSHTAATPIGGWVKAEAILTAVEGKKMNFTLTAWDNSGQIGNGAHERVIVNSERFMEKAVNRLR